MSSRTVIVVLGAIATIGLIVAGLWGWQRAETVATLVGWEKRMIGAWAVRCTAVALVAAAQALLLALVVERVYARDGGDDGNGGRPRDPVCAAARLSAVCVCMVCAASAIALGLAGR
jgi:hypothetical protein